MESAWVQWNAHMTTLSSRHARLSVVSLEQTQDEFYFGLPYRKLDLCLFGLNQNASPEAVAPAVGMTPEQVELVFRDIRRKRTATRPLHLHSLLVPNLH